MSLQEQLIRQRDFSAGEIDPDALRRDDTEPLKAGVRYARNLVSTHTGALVRRPGRRLLFRDSGVIFDFKPFDDMAYKVVFSATRVRIRTVEGALVASMVGPWGSADLDSIVCVAIDNEMFVAWNGRLKVLKVTEGKYTWSLSDFNFTIGLDNARRMPFYRFEATQNITMKVSAITGTGITVRFSDAVLNPLHVGAIFRYAGRQLRISAVHSSTVATANVIEDLPPTKKLTVQSGLGFSIGQIVETSVTNARGEIVSIDGDIIYIVLLNKLIIPTDDEKLVGPTASSKITGVFNAPPDATLQWDEQFVSDYRGWPRSVSKDRERLVMTNFKQKKNAIYWSATGDPRDGYVGAEANNAMLEFISAECQVFHVVGGYDEFAVTDKGVFYIPVSVGEPLKPGSVEFRPIFTSELANIRPIEVTEGLIFVDKSLTGVYAVTATGQTARPYIANEINRLHRHLFNDIRSIAATSATAEFPSRQIFVVNGDGTVVVGQFNTDTNYVGWLKWVGAGSVRSVAGEYGSVVFMSTYRLPGATVDDPIAEALDYSLLCDCATTISPGSFVDNLTLEDGQPLQLQNNATISLSTVTTSFYVGKTVSVFAGGFYFKDVAVPANGVIVGFGEYTEITLGLDFEWELRPLFTRFEGGQAAGQGEKRRKIADMMLVVRETQEFQVGNRSFGSYRGGDDMGVPVPKRDETYRYREVGRSYDPDVPIKSTFPGAFKLIELTTRITV